MDETRHRPVRRAELAGGAVTALLALAAFAGHATKTGLPWWAVLAVAVSTAGLAGWTGARIGRRGPRDEPLDLGDRELVTHSFREIRDAELPPRMR
ncbi:hypothetical protein ABTX62_33150 [Streptomyces sp. NPDC096046]|uniref:hypothetical protein n=1 Tax=Streptomyces sp. NPDC096046 TaxID=3155542 RepID=UPI00332C0A92